MKYVFIRKIDGTDYTGIADISGEAPKLLCYCNVKQAEIILEALALADVVERGESKFSTKDIIEIKEENKRLKKELKEWENMSPEDLGEMMAGM